MDCPSALSFTSLQISNGRAVDGCILFYKFADLFTEALLIVKPQGLLLVKPQGMNCQGHSDLVLTGFQTRRAGLKLKSYQKCMFVASFTRSCAVSVAFVSVPGTLCQCNVMPQISVQHHT